MSSTMMSSPVANLIAFLTNPLMLHMPATTIAFLQLTLTENFAPVFATKPAFTFKLSLTGLPPAIIYASAIAAGIFWEEWAKLFYACYSSEEMQIFITPAQIKVKIQGKPDVTVWSNPDIDELDLMSPVICIARRAVRSTVPAQLLKAARTRRASAEYEAIKLPTLNTIATSQPEMPDYSDSESENTSDVFQFSDNSSDDSSNTSASPHSEPCDLPAVGRRDAPSAKQPIAKADVTQYLYQGGRTNVVGGGVMLGAPSGTKQTPKPTVADRSRTPSPGFSPPKIWRRKACSVLLAPDNNNNWRTRARA